MRRFVESLRRWRMNRTPCTSGGWKHAELVWTRNSTRKLNKLAGQNRACEMLVASGLAGLATWIGACPACDNLVEWSTDKPRKVA